MEVKFYCDESFGPEIIIEKRNNRYIKISITDRDKATNQNKTLSVCFHKENLGDFIGQLLHIQSKIKNNG